MATATQDPHSPAHAAAAGTPAAIDPEHDIDAKTTILWLTACLTFVAITLWVLSQWFSFAVRGEEARKVDDLPRNELIEHRHLEAQWLANPSAKPMKADAPGTLEASNASIETATDAIIREYVNK